MLKSLSIENFKSFDSTDIKLSKLTLFTGANCSGKSSAIQALLILIHNIDKRKEINKNQASALNSYKVSLGEFFEIRNMNKNAKNIKIAVTDDIGSANVEISQGKETDIIVNTNADDNIINLFNSSNRRVHYLSANRQGAQDLYNKNINNFDKYGMLGEFAIDYFNNHKSQTLIQDLIKDESSPTLSTQIDYWLQYILKANIKTESIIGSDKIQTKFYINLNHKTSAEFRPKNVGSGLSYIIAILIMCLSSNRDDILIIENPEIHLHPIAQSRLTDFFVFVANAGIQIIIETHSDHIFNGIRKAIYKKQIVLDNVAVNYFAINETTLNTDYTYIDFSNEGKILKIPKGLFDQFDNDLNVLLGLE